LSLLCHSGPHSSGSREATGEHGRRDLDPKAHRELRSGRQNWSE
jgi:hypothetical protein